MGARTVKTGIAVSISVFLSGYVPYSSPLLAGLAAVICMQPSITASVNKGFTRIQTTVIAGLFGLVFYYVLGANILTLGLAVIVSVVLFNKLKWDESVVLASVIVITIMSEVADNVFYYTLGRVSSTLVGIGVATVTNILLVPPRHKSAFRKKLNNLTDRFSDLYIKAIEVFAPDKVEPATGILQDLNAVESDINSLKQELNHLKTGAGSLYGAYLEGIKQWEVALFERGVLFLEDELSKMHKVVEVAQNCRQQTLKLMQAGEIEISDHTNLEFTTLIDSIHELVHMLCKLHRSVFGLLGEKETESWPRIKQSVEQIDSLKKKLRQQLKGWQIKHIQELDIVSIMSICRIIYDLEEITDGLMELARASISSSGQEKQAEA